MVLFYQVPDSHAPVGEVVLNCYYAVEFVFVGHFLEFSEFVGQR